MQHVITEYSPTYNTITVVFNDEVTKTLNVPLTPSGEVDREALDEIIEQQKRGISNSRMAANTTAALDGHTLVNKPAEVEEPPVKATNTPKPNSKSKKKGG